MTKISPKATENDTANISYIKKLPEIELQKLVQQKNYGAIVENFIRRNGWFDHRDFREYLDKHI